MIAAILAWIDSVRPRNVALDHGKCTARSDHFDHPFHRIDLKSSGDEHVEDLDLARLGDIGVGKESIH